MRYGEEVEAYADKQGNGKANFAGAHPRRTYSSAETEARRDGAGTGKAGRQRIRRMTTDRDAGPGSGRSKESTTRRSRRSSARDGTTERAGE